MCRREYADLKTLEQRPAISGQAHGAQAAAYSISSLIFSLGEYDSHTWNCIQHDSYTWQWKQHDANTR